VSERVDQKLVQEALRLLRLGVDPDSVADRAPPRAPVMEILDFAAAQKVTGAVVRGLKTVEGGAGGAVFLLDRILAEERTQRDAMAGQAGEMIAAFAGAGIDLMLLKGGAHMAVSDFQPAIWRAMVDFDLLVREGDLQRSAALIEGLGYAPFNDMYDAEVDHHLPPYMRDHDYASVELHDSLSWVRCPAALDPDDVWRDAVRIESRGGPVWVPCPMHRAAHLVVHSQIADHNHHRRALRLRDVIDWRLLIKGGGVDLEALERRFASDGYGEEFRAFASLMGEIWEDKARPGWSADYAKRNRTILRGLADPASLRKYLMADIVRIVLGSFLDRNRFRRLMASLTDSERRRMKIGRLVEGLRR
jgi:hypothetical protein